jgi:cytochrome c-type biogenesis protein
MATVFALVKRHYAVIMAVGGAILIAMGVLVFTGQLGQLNARANELLDSLGLNFFTQV